MRLNIFVKGVILVGIALGFMGCATKYDDKMLEKYPKCYHQNMKIYQACIEKNQNGEPVTAMELENSALPHQYRQ